MDRESSDSVRELLITRKKQLVKLIQEQREEMGAIQSSRSPDWIDLTAATENIHLLMTLGDSERRELDDIEIALAKIADGSYGGCEGCGQAISPDRLEAKPTARLCKECKQQEEATLRPSGPDYSVGWRAIEQDPSLLARAEDGSQNR